MFRSRTFSDPTLLTEREMEVAELVAAGYTDKAIAEKLCIVRQTVDRHIWSIYGKMEAAYPESAHMHKRAYLGVLLREWKAKHDTS